MWVVMTLSASCMLIPWQRREKDLLLESTLIEMFDVVTHPPSLLGICEELVVRLWRPSIVQRISAAGFDGAVEHWKLTVSPWRASDGPAIVTCVGGTVVEMGGREKEKTNEWINYQKLISKREKSFGHKAIKLKEKLLLVYVADKSGEVERGKRGQ